LRGKDRQKIGRDLSAKKQSIETQFKEVTIDRSLNRVNCPSGRKTLSRFIDVAANQLKVEECDEYGKFYDAGEFTVWAKSKYS
jgi:hypothetical protein|tara:strand:- start:667 stop:915 length:249 start_codon:yes stop_codon:yes gene_type:complete